MTSYDKYLQVGLKAVEAANKIITSAYTASPLDFETKSDNSPVTVVDKNCEAIIQKIILDSFPDHAFLGEETGKSTQESEYVWIIDPIDGTKNFVRGIPLFATLVALMHRGEIVVGISHAPIMNETVWAAKSAGAFKNGHPIHVSNTHDIEHSYIGHGGIRAFDKIGQLQSLSDLSSNSWGGRGFGDAWSYHLVAQGALDANIEAKIKIWDIAAAAIITTEAGGQVSDINGMPVDINTSTFIASNGQIHQQILKYFEI